MGAILAWFRLDLRRTWRSLLMLALLVAFASGAVMTAVAGARRGSTALDRLASQTLPATVQILPNDPGFDWDSIRALAGVEAVAEVAHTSYELDGVPIQDDFIAADTEVMRTIERPVVLEGRLADPTRPDEAVVTAGFVASHGKGVGDTVTLRLYQPETLDAVFFDRTLRADGPFVETRIVGVVRSFLFADELEYAAGTLIPSAGLAAEYPENVLGASGAGFVSALVRLEGGGAAVADFQADLLRVAERSDINVWDHSGSVLYGQRIVDFEAEGLLVFALAAGIAAVLLVGQAIARYSSATMADLRALMAVGLTPNQVRGAVAVGPALAAAAGATMGAVGAVFASRWFPIGSAALVEPTPGVDVDWWVLAAGWTVPPLLVTAGAGALAWSALRFTRPATLARRSAVANGAERAGMPVPMVIGSRFALEPGRGPEAVPGRPALFGAVTGVIGIVAAFTLSSGITDAAGVPARYGQVHQLQATLGEDGLELVQADELLSIIADDPEVLAVNDSRVSVAEAAGVAAAVYSLDPVGAPMDIVVTRGRLPSSSDEIALAPFTATAMDVDIGGTIEVTGTRATRQLTVTGLAFLPEGPENYYSTGAWVTGTTFDHLFETFTLRTAHIALRSEADPAAVATHLEAAASSLGDGHDASIQPSLQRDHSGELRTIRALPVFLAGFLAVLGLGAVGHALATAVRRRRHQLAVLRAVGMTPGQCRGVVVTHAIVVASIALVVGMPLGVALGRTVWRYVADVTLVHYVPPTAFRALVLIVPMALLAVILLAVWPSHRAASMRVSQVLRAE